jgi:hypothetical protein
MDCLHNLRTGRAMRVVALLGYLLVVATTLATPWLQPMAFGSVCSAAAGDTERDATIGCALCLPPAAPPQGDALVSLAHAPADAWQPRSHQPLLEAQPVDLPPARAPPVV